MVGLEAVREFHIMVTVLKKIFAIRVKDTIRLHSATSFCMMTILFISRIVTLTLTLISIKISRKLNLIPKEGPFVPERHFAKLWLESIARF